MNDEELRSLLREWEAPRAPASLRGRVLRNQPWSWGWLMTGERRFALPLALASVSLIVFSGWWLLRPRPAGTLSDFEQVTRFEPRIVRNMK
jgi:hypothetical protein